MCFPIKFLNFNAYYKISFYMFKEIGAQIVKTIVRGNIVYDINEGVSNKFPGEFILNK